MESLSDSELMTEVKNGDIDRLGILFERYHRRLFAFFYRLTSRQDVSEDLVQGVFERILKYRSSWNANGRFTAWLFGIARNLHADHCNARAPEQLMDERLIDEMPLIMNGSTHGADTEQAEDDTRWLVLRALDHLDPDKRQVLVLSRFEGFRYREIAQMMNCTESAVKVRVFRAMNEMRETITAIRSRELL
jgi:RNA polymerase sigma factor (sigma-70 family)